MELRTACRGPGSSSRGGATPKPGPQNRHQRQRDRRLVRVLGSTAALGRRGPAADHMRAEARGRRPRASSSRSRRWASASCSTRSCAMTYASARGSRSEGASGSATPRIRTSRLSTSTSGRAAARPPSCSRCSEKKGQRSVPEPLLAGDNGLRGFGRLGPPLFDEGGLEEGLQAPFEGSL